VNTNPSASCLINTLLTWSELSDVDGTGTNL
jgi:hypothetical protein